MSDFEKVLERLLDDPSFQGSLAADPTAALAGYDLSGEERELLQSQLSAGTGGDRTVEDRTTKSGVMGLLGPVAAAFGVAAAGSSLSSRGGGPSESLGGAPGGSEAAGGAPSSEFLGVAPGGSSESLGAAPNGQEVFGRAGGSLEDVGTAPGDSGSSVGEAPPAEVPAYRPNVDVDGDGQWDSYTTREGPDGIEIVADMDGDGRADFVGHDTDRDGLVDFADYDNNVDGTLEIRMYDDDGDGWMDRSEQPGSPG